MPELLRKPVDHRRYRSFEYEGVAYHAAYTIIQAAQGRRLHAKWLKLFLGRRYSTCQAL